MNIRKMHTHVPSPCVPFMSLKAPGGLRTQLHGINRHLALLLCLLCLASCKTSDDATAAAKQLATTATDLANYYGALSQIVATLSPDRSR